MIQSSVLSIDQSSLSVLNQPQPVSPKSPQLFKQCSQYRTQIRTLTQQNEWLQSTNQGLTNECNVLKQLLNQKKAIIVECNTDLRIANQEINRLEDLVFQREEDIRAIREQQGMGRGVVGALEREVAELRGVVGKLEKELEEKNRHIDALVREKQMAKIQFESKQKAYIHEIQQRVLKVLQRYHKSPQQPLPSQNNPSLLNQPQSPPANPNLTTLLTKTHSLTQTLQKTHQQTTSQLLQTTQTLSQKQQQILTLQFQLKEATDLVEEYQMDNGRYQLKVRELEGKCQELVRVNQRNQRNLGSFWDGYRRNFGKVLGVLEVVVGEHQDVLNRLAQLIKANNNEYQIDIVLHQLKQLLTSTTTPTSTHLKTKKQLSTKETSITLLQQQYESLKLKHLTLQRQFQAILDDNRRILKFHQLSRFRVERNMRNNGGAQ